MIEVIEIFVFNFFNTVRINKKAIKMMIEVMVDPFIRIGKWVVSTKKQSK